MQIWEKKKNFESVVSDKEYWEKLATDNWFKIQWDYVFLALIKANLFTLNLVFCNFFQSHFPYFHWCHFQMRNVQQQWELRSLEPLSGGFHLHLFLVFAEKLAKPISVNVSREKWESFENLCWWNLRQTNSPKTNSRIYSEKATKLCKISTNYLSYVLQVK